MPLMPSMHLLSLSIFLFLIISLLSVPLGNCAAERGSNDSGSSRSSSSASIEDVDQQWGSGKNRTRVNIRHRHWGYHAGVLRRNARIGSQLGVERDLTQQLFFLADYNENHFPTDYFKLNCSVPICEGPLAEIYCTGQIVFAAWYFGFQATCPGTKLLFEPDEVVANYRRLDTPVKVEDFRRFCDTNFDTVPFLESAQLNDWTPEPKGFAAIVDERMRKFAHQLNLLWEPLAKKFIADVYQNQSRYPVLPVPNHFIVPGGHFQVYFYWDTYWIHKGLLFSDLHETALGMLENFAHIIQFRGYIPNSGDIQLSRRSQPPLFTLMLADYWDDGAAGVNFLNSYLPLANREMEWWDANRRVNVSAATSGSTKPSGEHSKASGPLDTNETKLKKPEENERRGEHNEKDSKNHFLYQYKAESNCPRPENFLEDYQVGVESALHDPEFIWSSTASACESGLDFSTRWFGVDGSGENQDPTPPGRRSIRTNRLIPVDLNVFMVKNFVTLARLYEASGLDDKEQKAAYYRKKAQDLRGSIDALLRDKNPSLKGAGIWFDYDMEMRELRRHNFYPSNIYPLMLLEDGNTTAEERNASCEAALSYLRDSGALILKGGMPSSLRSNSTEQWDFPNGWAPVQHLVVSSLSVCQQSPEALATARGIAEAFLTTAYNGLFNPPKGAPAQMWEKYDVRYSDGRSGFGGEYPVQPGFGWTNGVVLDFIKRYYTGNATTTMTTTWKKGRGRRVRNSRASVSDEEEREWESRKRENSCVFPTSLFYRLMAAVGLANAALDDSTTSGEPLASSRWARHMDEVNGPANEPLPISPEQGAFHVLPMLFVFITLAFCIGIACIFLYTVFIAKRRPWGSSGNGVFGLSGTRFWSLDDGMGAGGGGGSGGGLGSVFASNSYSSAQLGGGNNSKQESERRLLLSTRCARGGDDGDSDEDSSGSDDLRVGGRSHRERR